MNHSTPGLPIRHQLLEFTQTHVHRDGDAMQPSHPLSSPSPPAPNPSQHQSLFQWVNSSHEVAKVLEFEFQLQHQSFQWTPRTGSPLGWTGWISYPSLNISCISCFSAPAQQYYSCAWERFWVRIAWLGAPVKEWRTREGTEIGFVTEVVVRDFPLGF